MGYAMFVAFEVEKRKIFQLYSGFLCSSKGMVLAIFNVRNGRAPELNLLTDIVPLSVQR